jgi:hypothetical protein
MLQLRETRITRTKHANVMPGVIIPEEGMACVYAKDNGETKVTLSTGAPGEIFAGVSWSRNSAPASLPHVQESSVPTSRIVELVRTPIAGQLNVKLGGLQLDVVSTAPADATEVQLVGRNLVFFAGSEMKAYAAQFLYAPTVTEARTIIGDGPHGGLASTAQSVIGLVKDAYIATNAFDASADWSNAMHVQLAAGGTFAPGTAEDHIPNVIVLNAPNASNPFLVMSINVA